MKNEAHAKPDNHEPRRIPAEISLRDLAPILGIHKRNVERRATAENWPYEEVTARGGKQKRFKLEHLPPEIRRRVEAHYGLIPEEELGWYPVDWDARRAAKWSEKFRCSAEWQQREALARLEVVRALQAFLDSFPGKRSRAVAAFVKQYKEYRAPGVRAEVYDLIKPVSRTQYYEWLKRYDLQGIYGLVRKHGKNRGSTVIPPHQQKAIEALHLEHPSWGGTRIAEALLHQYGDEEAPGRHAVDRYLRWWRAENPDLDARARSPQHYNNVARPAFGDMPESATHFLSEIEVDSTIADVRCSDGSRWNLSGLIDRYSRCAMFLVSRTSDSWTITALVRRCCEEWGLPELVVRDNGKDYASGMVKKVLESLECRVRINIPRSPWMKPHIERMFGTLNSNLLEKLPGYVGHNVAEQQDIRSRKRTIEVGLTAEQLQQQINEWVSTVYHNRRHSQLGRTPNEQRSLSPRRPGRIDDPEALRILLAVPRKPDRTIQGKGIKFEGHWYISGDLVIGQKVNIRYDLEDAGRIFVFHRDTNEYLGEALNGELAGLTVEDKNRATKQAAKRHKERWRAAQTIARENYRDPLTEELQYYREKSGTVENLPVGEPATNPAIEGAKQAADAVREREAAANPQSGGVFEETGAACSAPTGGDQAATKVVQMRRAERTPAVSVEPQEELFPTPLARFKYLLKQQRNRQLTSDELAWLDRMRERWMWYPMQFAKDWPEADQRWLSEIAPDLFHKIAVGE